MLRTKKEDKTANTIEKRKRESAAAEASSRANRKNRGNVSKGCGRGGSDSTRRRGLKSQRQQRCGRAGRGIKRYKERERKRARARDDKGKRRRLSQQQQQGRVPACPSTALCSLAALPRAACCSAGAKVRRTEAGTEQAAVDASGQRRRSRRSRQSMRSTTPTENPSKAEEARQKGWLGRQGSALGGGALLSSRV